MARMHLTQALHKGVSQVPQATAVVFGERRRSYAEVAARVARLAAALRALGLQPGDRAGMLALNCDRYLEFFYGTWWAGGVVNPVNIRWSPGEIAYSLDDCDTRILFVDAQFQPLAGELRQRSLSLKTLVYVGEGPVPQGMLGYEDLLAAHFPCEDAQRGGDDVAAVMYTGGTTGQPKGVMLTHANMFTNSLNSLATIARGPEVVCVQTAPMFHIGGAALMLQVLQWLGKQVILPAFDETVLLETLQREKGTETFIVPTMLKRMIEHPRFSEYDLSSLQILFYGAAPIDEALLEQALRKLPAAGFWQVYGMTELSPVVTALPPRCHRPGAGPAGKLRSAGLPLPSVEVRIVDPQGQPVATGVVGEITVRGPTVMAGYWNKAAETAAVLRDGWLRTGDGGRMDEDGFVYVVDRIKDMVVTGGENVYCAEVENAITQLPEVSLCAVIGVPDEKWGERVHAVVVLREGARLEAATLIDHCKTRIAGYKCPRSVEFVDTIALSAAGKILKYKLRERYWAGRDRRVA